MTSLPSRGVQRVVVKVVTVMALLMEVCGGLGPGKVVVVVMVGGR